jgi:hypothetical protein
VVVDEHVDLDDVAVEPAFDEPDVVVVDEATDAAVAADGAAGRELELDEFDQTLAQSDLEADTAARAGEGHDDDLLNDLLEEPASYLDAVPEGDEFERGLQSLVSDELAPGPVEGAPGQLPTEPSTSGLSEADSVPGAFGGPAVLDEPPAEVAETAVEDAPLTTASATATEAKSEETPLTAAGLVKRTPKKKSEDATGGGMPVMAARTTASGSQRSPEEVRKMLSRYRSGLNKGRGGADDGSTDTTDS